MAAFNRNYYDRTSENPDRNPQVATYNGTKDFGDATVTPSRRCRIWWDGTLAANTTSDILSVADIGQGVFVDCACNNGNAIVLPDPDEQVGEGDGDGAHRRVFGGDGCRSDGWNLESFPPLRRSPPPPTSRPDNPLIGRAVPAGDSIAIPRPGLNFNASTD